MVRVTTTFSRAQARRARLAWLNAAAHSDGLAGAARGETWLAGHSRRVASLLVLLSDLTTLRLGGPAAQVVTATSAGELVDAVRTADEAGDPVLVVGGGSNLVVADSGWPGVVVLVRSLGVTRDGGVVTAQAGEVWDDFVARTVAEGWSGLAPMSGIPGLTGATPVQNVGEYGTEVAGTSCFS